MSKKNNKKTVTNKDDNVVENFWLKKILPKKVKTLPYDKLTRKEQEIIDKVNKTIPLTDEELRIIKKTTAEYGEALEKYDAEEIIKSHEEFSNIVTTEHERFNSIMV